MPVIREARFPSASYVAQYASMGPCMSVGAEIWSIEGKRLLVGRVQSIDDKGIWIERSDGTVFRTPMDSIMMQEPELAMTKALKAAQEWVPSGSEARASVWGADSTFRGTLYHGTGSANIRSILRVGFAPGKQLSSTNAGIYGRGFYFTEKVTEAQKFAVWGGRAGKVIDVRIRVQKTWTDEAKFYKLFRKHEKVIGYPRGYKSAIDILDAVTDEIKSLGYDSIFIQGEWVIFDKRNIMVVVK